MTGVPPPTLYHRWLGWHAPAMRRAITVLIAGLIVAVVLLPFITWGLALTGGWNAAALTFLLTTWSIIIRADSSRAPQLAAREDQTEGSARVLLVGASVASLLGAGYALHLAGQKSGAPRMLLIGAAVLTVVLSWAVINTVYTLRYVDQHFRFKPGGIAFGAEDDQQHPGYRDFAYVAFTIGMTYQVSDTHAARPPDPAYGAYPRHPVLCVRRRHRRRLGQPHLRAVPVARGNAWSGRWRRADGEAPGWRGEIRTRSAAGRIANTSGGLSSTASPSIPACTGPGALTSRRDALQARPGASGLSPGGSMMTIPSWPPPSVGRVPRASGRSSA